MMRHDVTEQLETRLSPPYLIFLGDTEDPAFAKTGAGIVQWRPELVAGQLRLTSAGIDLGIPDLTLRQAVEKGVRSLVVGIAPVGGNLSPPILDVLVEAASHGLDIVSGLHTRLATHPALVDAADASGARLIDVRVPPPDLPIGTGAKRTGKRLLTVGTDCAVGKKYSALAISASMQRFDVSHTFRATGQTGIMIAGSGIPIDSVVCDFLAGAAERLSPDNDEDHWDVIEGQGSLFNPAYAGVSLGLLHGSQPDAIVLCHDASRKSILNAPSVTIPSLAECLDLNIRCARLTNADATCAGVCVNSSGLPIDERAHYLASISADLGVPCVDPLVDGCDAIVERLVSSFSDSDRSGRTDQRNTG